MIRHGLWVVLGITAIVRLIHLGFMAAYDPFFHQTAVGTDMETYWKQGTAIAGGDFLLRSYSGAFYYGPLYSYFLVPFIWISGGKLAFVHLVQFALGLGLPALCWLLARTLHGPAAAMGAGMLAGLCVPILFWNQTVLVEGLNLLLISAGLTLLVLATQRENRQPVVCRTVLGLWTLSGALFGLAVSGRGNTLLVILGLAVVRAWIPAQVRSSENAEAASGSVWWYRWNRRRSSVILAGCFLAGAMTTLALPVARNLIVARKVAITTNGPAMLYIGNYRDAIGVLTSSPHLEALMSKYSGEVPYIAELRKDIAADPWNLVRLQWLKTRIFFNSYDAPDNFSLDLYARYSPVLRYNPIGWSLVVALGGLGIWHLRRRLGPSGDLWPLTAFLVLFPLSIIPVLVVGRYRLPWLFPLVVLGGVGTVWLIEAIRARRGSVLTAVGLWAVAVIWGMLPKFSPASEVISIDPEKPRYIRPNDWSAFAVGMQSARWPEKNIQEVIRAGIAENPENPMLVLGESKRLFDLNRHQETLPILEAYLRYQPRDLMGARHLAMALIYSNRQADARNLLQQILQLDPNDSGARTMLNSIDGNLRPVGK